jgi:metal-responsive CopG/Arc/MetJ family transcriptional regulator
MIIYSPGMKNVQITVDPETLAEVDRAGEALGFKRSEIVRQALREWLRRRDIQRFEDEWVAALGRRRDDDGAEWRSIQAWSKK